MNRTPPRLKWHMLRRQRSDPAFLRKNLAVALDQGAPCEVDIVFSSDSHAFCLHDLTLDRETTGTGLAAHHTRAEIERLRQRGPNGAMLGSPPLFLDEIAAMVRRNSSTQTGQVQLDIKAPIEALTLEALNRIEATIGDIAPCFIAGGYDWTLIQRLAAAVPGLQAGFDPLAHYPRSCALDRNGFVEVGEKTLAIAPGAAMYYLEAKLVLGALEQGVNLIKMVGREGAMIDVWTLDENWPALRQTLRRVIEAGCHQITSNDPDILYPLIEDIARDCAVDDHKLQT